MTTKTVKYTVQELQDVEKEKTVYINRIGQEFDTEAACKFSEDRMDFMKKIKWNDVKIDQNFAFYSSAVFYIEKNDAEFSNEFKKYMSTYCDLTVNFKKIINVSSGYNIINYTFDRHNNLDASIYSLEEYKNILRQDLLNLTKIENNYEIV
jgi:hypothetical protein